ncbi:MAG TPA: DUF1800 domain-containing protein [Acidobacteriaceae bacterium]|jgi:uncharacterized protein (DUF1800 family)
MSMISSRSIRRIVGGLLALSFVCFTIPGEGHAKTHAAAKAPPLTRRERAEHALDRLSFGARPGDVERVERMGVERWIDEQLHPERIDDTALQARLSAFPAMRLSAEELIQRYPPPAMVRQVDAGKIAMPADPVERAIYANAVANFREHREKKTQADGGAAAAMHPAMEVSSLLRLPVDARWRAVLAMQPGTVRPLVQQMTGAERQQLVAGMTPEQKEVLLALVQPARVVTEELQDEKLMRAVYSQRQLEEVMTNFWSNHFNIYLHKNGEMPWYLADYERDVIRPHAMGKFEDLLVAVAHSPAMLVYLDNQQSIGPHSVAAMRASASGAQKKSAPGLNENYARELMELHTLGVNGGYTQQDVVEVAKVLTGWGTEGRQQGYGFQFNERRHEPGEKVVLGHTIGTDTTGTGTTGENGEAEGMEVLHLLAMSPATAHFLSTQLATEFVSDTPPKRLVDRMTKTYLKTHGDIRQVLITMFHSPEFWSRDAYRAKLKTPLEFVASSLRATDADVENANALAASLGRLGMPLFGVQQPNGYSLKADPWLGAEALLGRMNFALALTANRIPGVRVVIPEDTQQSELQLEQALLDGEVAAHTHDVVMQEMESAQAAPVTAVAFAKGHAAKGMRDPFAPAVRGGAPMSQSELAAALLLGSPDFQRR